MPHLPTLHDWGSMHDTCDQRCRSSHFRMRIRGRKPRVMALRQPRCRVASAALTPRRSCNSSRSRQALLSKAFRVITVASTSFKSSGVAWRICIHSTKFDGGVHAVCAALQRRNSTGPSITICHRAARTTTMMQMRPPSQLLQHRQPHQLMHHRPAAGRMPMSTSAAGGTVGAHQYGVGIGKWM